MIRPSRAWLTAAVLVVTVALGVAWWLQQTAARLDQSTLENRAESLADDIEEQVRTVDFTVGGMETLLSGSLDTDELLGLTGFVSLDVILVWDYIAEFDLRAGSTGGDILWSIAPNPGNPVFQLTEADLAAFSASSDPLILRDGSQVAIIRGSEEGNTPGRGVGVVISLDKIIESAIDSEGPDSLAAFIYDMSSGDGVPIASGDSEQAAASSHRLPLFVPGADWELETFPGPEFTSAQQLWVPAIVIGSGLVIAGLLIWASQLQLARATEMRERLELSEAANRGKDQFLAAVSHELRTPLTVVLGMADVLANRWTAFDAGERETMLAMVTEQAAEASNIVEDLLVAARADTDGLAVVLTPTEVEPQVEYALRSIPEQERPRIEIGSLPLAVEADRTRLRQIIRNLIDNAVRHGGRSITVHGWVDGPSATIVVDDDGPGISPEDLERVFQPYERLATSMTAPSGVGIGLHVSRLLARLMGGDLRLASPGDGGTRFELVLPAAVADDAAAA